MMLFIFGFVSGVMITGWGFFCLAMYLRWVNEDYDSPTGYYKEGE